MPVTPSSDDLAARIRHLEARLNELSRGTLTNAVISQGGITIRDLGGIELSDQDGETVFFVGGAGGSWSRPDGTPQPITSISDDRGRWRIAVFDPAPADHGYRQFVAIWDYNGNIILGDDANSGEGLARPYIPHTVSRGRSQDWPASTATDWEPLDIIRLHRQHPQLYIEYRHTSDEPNTRGEIRLRDTQAGVLATKPVGYVTVWERTQMPMPGVFGDMREIWLEARRTTGPGNIRATVVHASGIQS